MQLKTKKVEGIIMQNAMRKSIKDSDIDLHMVERRLLEISKLISRNNKKNLTDINIVCEEIFGKILNRIYGLKLRCMSEDVSGTFIAVDLLDKENRIAYQVTSQYERKKINSTIQKFNTSELYGDIDELRFLVLSSVEHKYNGKDTIELKNGNIFSFTEHILNFNGLISEIERKAETDSNFIAEVYDDISMVFDSGRLQYRSIVEKTEQMKQSISYDLLDNKDWRMGYGDIYLRAFIPLNYEEKLSCMLQIRKNDVSGASITFEQEKIFQDFFVSEKEFEAKHNVGRNECGEEMWVRFDNIYFDLNGHTVYHIYKVFDELKKVYFEEQKKINEILGVNGLVRKGDKYLLMTIGATEWEEILFFARNHDTHRKDDEIKWNIFTFHGKNSLSLLPNVYEGVREKTFANLFVTPNEISDNKLDLYWKPGFYADGDCMDYFDNIIKWKADFTAEWIINELIPKAHLYYEYFHRRQCCVKRITNRLFNCRVPK